MVRVIAHKTFKARIIEKQEGVKLIDTFTPPLFGTVLATVWVRRNARTNLRLGVCDRLHI